MTIEATGEGGLGKANAKRYGWDSYTSVNFALLQIYLHLLFICKCTIMVVLLKYLALPNFSFISAHHSHC